MKKKKKKKKKKEKKEEVISRIDFYFEIYFGHRTCSLGKGFAK